MENQEILNIFQEARRDPELFSTMNIEQLLNSIEKGRNDYLENKTMNDITADIFNRLQSRGLINLCNKLVGYRLVDEIYELHKGKHVRWLNRQGTLTKGGTVVDIQFLETGVQVLCKNHRSSRFFRYKFDECLTFQQLTVEEQLLLMAYEYLQK